jgi:hypothetical protein
MERMEEQIDRVAMRVMKKELQKVVVEPMAGKQTELEAKRVGKKNR